ncbi:hypothetical protein HU200_066170 [Digitaria exilis]|uniref:PROP1-like PPR domain-containing protein n=1 Tax=Digitaria exilis TaxID=1010633 RepID=A0A835A855_9POAL|nr:hypothetical protein HU200_066170 [Digitaria exilis]
MSEAALTAKARMALSMGDGDMAFEIVKQMKDLGITPKLRSYGPALTAFCNSGNVDKAFEVEAHMLKSGITPEEAELEMLLRASIYLVDPFFNVQKWLEKHGPFEAVVDAANVGLFSHKHLSLS